MVITKTKTEAKIPKTLEATALGVVSLAEKYQKLDPGKTVRIDPYKGGGFYHPYLMVRELQPVHKNFMVLLANAGDARFFLEVAKPVLKQDQREKKALGKTGASPTGMLEFLGIVKALEIIKPKVQGSLDLLQKYARALEAIAFGFGKA